MTRKIQLVALIVGMVLVGVERFTAQAAAATTPDRTEPSLSSGIPVPPPNTH